MLKESITIAGKSLPFIDIRVAVVGSGAAGLNASVHLRRMGVDGVAIVTEKMGAGTSANAGSDKQTYYRLNPTGASPDSSLEMARDLFDGHCMHGDIALVESALSPREFYHLVEAGVPFPQNRFGEYVGFQTDHDSKFRGTSAGPRTSIQMVDRLAAEVARDKTPVLDGYDVIDLLIRSDGHDNRVAGLMTLDEAGRPLVIKTDFVVYATGGPGALYADSVYPPSQIGSLGIALKAGARAQNLGESQFGIASKGFRWNLSGSYQQVLPRYISTQPDGSDISEFLNDVFPSAESLLQAQFLKGYQWPFDARKVSEFGSSMIDLAVYRETKMKGRRVFLDYSRNPTYPGFEFSVERLPPMVRDYLKKSGADQETPVVRLKRMNMLAYDLFARHGIDLEKQILEIGVCHQHCNGGLIGSIWWESNLANFFPVGECNGSHGLYRPGGSALNSGQVGSLRASEMIRHRVAAETASTLETFLESQRSTIETKLDHLNSLHDNDKPVLVDPVEERKTIQQRMSTAMGIVRNLDTVETALEENERMLETHNNAGIPDKALLPCFLKNEDLLLTERAFLESARRTLQVLKGGRGSYLIGELQDFLSPTENKVQKAGESVTIPDDSLNNRIVEFSFDSTGKGRTNLAKVRPIPTEDNWFEKVWAEYRDGKHFGTSGQNKLESKENHHEEHEGHEDG
ncbi:MAG: FAD-binding protein [Proteobacteria bacterium]|nr:FAD-binding protein [Pseudomonadota bacterium]